jgi:hypothetical protein
MLKFFKVVAILEGISYLALFSNMLFIKPNNFDLYKSLLYPIGMSHGVVYRLCYCSDFIKKISKLEL